MQNGTSLVLRIGFPATVFAVTGFLVNFTVGILLATLLTVVTSSPIVGPSIVILIQVAALLGLDVVLFPFPVPNGLPRVYRGVRD